MNQVRTKAIHIGNKYKIQVEPMNFEWDRFFATLEKDFSDILNEILSNNSQQQQQPLISNKKGSTPNENIEKYHGEIDNRT